MSDDPIEIEELEPEPMALPAMPVAGSTTCLRCGYSLDGLREDGVCPECGMPVARTLEGDLLRYSDPMYVESLHRGVLIVFWTMLAQVVLQLGGMALGMAMTFANAQGVTAFVSGVSIIGVGLELLRVLGWWMLTTPDPASALGNKGSRARVIVRFAVFATAGVTVAQVVMQWMMGTAYAPSPTLGAVAPLIVVAVVAVAAAATQYFASLIYIRWIAGRIPNPHIDARAKLLMWLGPILYVFGCGIGGIVALVMFLTMLHWVRSELRGIMAARRGEIYA